MKLGEKIRKLRMAEKMTQAELAEACGVSFQAVQKWESDAYAPTLEKLALLSKRFSVSLDELVLDRSDRLLEEQKRVRLLPEYACVPDDESYPEQLRVEYTQSVQEGRDVAAYQELFEQVRRMPRGEFKERMADVLFDLTTGADQAPDYPFAEPSDYEGIRAQWAEDRPADQPVAAETMRERIAGAWYGRICGCLLGKTVEGIRTPELTALLKATGNYPMRRYILRAELTDELLQATNYPLATRCYADAIPCAPADDDTNYTVLYQELIRKYGRDFTPYDVSRMWLDSQPKNAYCTAERVAFINFVKGFTPPASAVHKNPYREWIGAQIRADYFGYINPGRPETAAEMAWRDASVSHVKNGIYGEMWVAALLALAARTDSVEDALYASLKFIPRASRLMKHLTEVIRDYEEKTPAEQCFAHIHARWDEFSTHDWCHTISNAEIVTASLLYGRGDYGKSICMAVQTGFDTDCNGATIGSVIGMCRGRQAIGEEWTRPLHGRLDTAIFGVGTVEIDDRIEMTLRDIT